MRAPRQLAGYNIKNGIMSRYEHNAAISIPKITGINSRLAIQSRRILARK